MKGSYTISDDFGTGGNKAYQYYIEGKCLAESLVK